MSLNTEQKEILTAFQSDYTRLVEEQFAQILTERSDVRLFFINENRCFTDGKNITLDPSMMNLFVDNKALSNAEKFLSLDDSISKDPWLALQMKTRASNIHESLHILYTDFPPKFIHDKRSKNEICRLVLAQINNLIEDIFIEAAGCSLYDNLEHFLLWNRIIKYFSTVDLPDTLEQRFSDAGISIDTKDAYKNIEQSKNDDPIEEDVKDNDNTKFARLILYLNYMGCLVLYPFYKMNDPPDPISEYVEKTKKLFFEAEKCGSPSKRADYCCKIFDIIEPLIPDSDKLDLPQSLQYLMDDLKANDTNNSSFGNHSSNGKEAIIKRTLFKDENGQPLSFDNSKEKIKNDMEKFENDKKLIYSTQKNEPQITNYDYKNFDCSNLHKNIKLEVIKPKINKNLRRAYQNMIAKYKLPINSFSTQIGQYLKINIEEIEDKQLFGSGLNTRQFADRKRRFWYRKTINPGIPDIGFLFMVDGSGSMEGDLNRAVIASMVILHEVLRNNNIQHSIVEHRAIYEEPKLIHNILVDFNNKKEESYNILGIEADEGTREGFSLYWAEKYIQKNCLTEHKVIVMISDGAPAHTCEDPIDYVPPISIKDTAEAAKKIIKRGTAIVAIALDNTDENNCYDQLRFMYPSVVSCTDISKLTGQLFHVISKSFKGKV